MKPLDVDDSQSAPLSSPAHEVHSHLPEFEGAVLREWVKLAQPTSIVEVGLGFAVSTLNILSALDASPPVSYLALDPNQDRDWHGAGRETLRRAGELHRVEIVLEGSEIALPRLLSEGRRIDFAFVDGFHTFDQMMVEFYYLDRLLQPGGFIVFDDAQLPSVQKLSAYIDTYPNYRHLSLPGVLGSSRIARVRSMMGVPPARIIGFEKTGVFERRWSWFEDF